MDNNDSNNNELDKDRSHRRLLNLLSDVDVLVNRNIELRGYILIAVDQDYSVDLIFQGESRQTMLDGLDKVLDSINSLQGDNDLDKDLPSNDDGDN